MATSLTSLLLVIAVLNITNANDLGNERNIKGKVVIVTGAAQGIGYAIADNFSKNGARVVLLLDIQKKKGKQAERKLNSKYGANKTEFIECDIRKDLDRVSKLIMKKYKYVDVLINNAGIGHENDPQSIIETNAMGTILWSLNYLKYMRKDKGGKGGAIINVSSIAARNVDPIYDVYRATKLAVLGFSISRGHLYNYDITGVRIITLSPGPTDTALVDEGYCFYDRQLIDKIVEYFNYSYLQTPDNVGKGAVKLFKIAESGTSWDVANEKAPIKSNNTIDIVPFDKVENNEDDDSQAKNEKFIEAENDDENDGVKTFISVKVI